jgi:hypothetical protein
LRWDLWAFFVHVDQETSHQLIDEISLGDLIRKPGWIRMSVHPPQPMQIEFVCDGIKALAKKIIKLGQLIINKNTNEFYMRTQTRLWTI